MGFLPCEYLQQEVGLALHLEGCWSLSNVYLGRVRTCQSVWEPHVLVRRLC